MTEMEQGLRRSPALMSRFDTSLLVVDVQEKLLNLMEFKRILGTAIRYTISILKENCFFFCNLNLN